MGRAERGRLAARRGEAGARALGASTVEIRDFEDAFFRYGRDVKDYFETLKRFEPDVVLTHTDNDRHQDHRLVCELSGLAEAFYPRKLVL